MRISVALCTYNGAQYLQDQLDSVSTQTRPPDELVVCDDASRDDTVAMVKEFAVRVAFPVRVVCNVVNVGSTKNFERAIALCDGDIIALCDQDDVWKRHKLRTLEAAFLHSECAVIAASDADLVDADGRPTGARLWDAVGFTPRLRAQFHAGDGLRVLMHRTCLTGATMAFRTELRGDVLPIPADWVHDAWIALIGSALGGIALIDEPLVAYRQHPRQQIGAGGGGPTGLMSQVSAASRLTAEHFERLAGQFEAVAAALRTLGPRVRDRDAAALLALHATHLRMRGQVRARPRYSRGPAVVRELIRGNYGRFGVGFLGWKSIAADLLFRSDPPS